MNIGKRITELREDKKITTNRLANMAGISQSYLRDIELGGKNPTVEILSYICDALNISLSDFFTETQSDIPVQLLSAVKMLNREEQEALALFIYKMKK
ncbi:MAG: helix-turn-helix transcriptional regulator [Clostridia bacterium]|nr:helix-turn-helix transcriptional regulator [Clostridia bacterium]